MLFVAVVLTGFVVAAIIRRFSPVRTWISPAATTILAMFGAFTTGLSLMDVTEAPWRPVLTIAGAAAAGALVTHLGAAINRYAFDPLRRYRTKRGHEDDVMTRLQHRVESREKPDRRINLVSLIFGSVHRAQRVRVTGLAAEMTYYGLISLVPLTLALGSSLGFLERILGAEQVADIEQSLIDGVATVFASDVTDDLLVPLIEGLLAQERAGVAITSVVVVLWLAGRMFRAAIRALDDAYAVPERRSFIGQQVLGLVLALGAVITVLTLVAMVVIGPLLGGAQQIAEQFGLGRFWEVAWAVLRWPAVAAVVAAYLTLLYRYGPNVDTVWTRCLPGAVLGTILLIGISLGFGQYLAFAGTSILDGAAIQDSAVQTAAQTVGLVLAGVLWMWLTSIALLSGGVLNAELQRELTRPKGASGQDTRATDQDATPDTSGTSEPGSPASAGPDGTEPETRD